jgi:hypothetical protein
LYFSPPQKMLHLDRSSITTRPFWKISVFVISLKNLRVFQMGRSPITIRPLWKISVFFTTLKNLCFSSGQVAHYNKTTLKNLYTIFVFFTWAGRPLQQDHFEKSLYFSPLSKTISTFFTNLKNLCIFHQFEKSLYFSPLWKILVFFTCVSHP